MSMPMDYVYDYLKEQKYPKSFSTSEKRTLRKRSENFTIKDGVLYYSKGWRDLSLAERSKAPLREAVRNRQMKIQIVLAAHTSETGGPHLGHHKVLQKLSQQYYWTGMHADVRQILKMCHTCMMGRDMVMDVDADESADENQDSSMADQSLADNMAMIEMIYANSSSTELKPLDGVFYMQDDIDQGPKYFWESVEFDIFGPYPSTPDAEDKLYVVVFMDGYSAWPEAFVLDNTNLSSIVMTIFKLISRFGLMSGIIERKQRFSKQLGHVFEDLALTECPVEVKYKSNSKLDSRWCELEKAVEEFVVCQPIEWYKYLDFCLLPYRISRAEGLDYTPSYISSSREMRLPTSINHQTSANHIELHLSENQVTESIAQITELFKMAVRLCESSDVDEDNVRERGGHEEEDVDYGDTSMDPLDEDMDFPSPQTPATPKTLSRKSKGREGKTNNSNEYGNLYVAIKRHLMGNGYPPNYNLSMKRSIRKVGSRFSLVDGKLFYQGSKCLKEVVMFDDAMFRVIQQAHVDSAGQHLSLKQTYQKVSEHYHWKGISLDTHAFLQACPQCAVKVVKSKETTDTLADTPDKVDDEKSDWYSDCTEELKPVIEYLKNKTIPDGYTAKNESALKMKSYMYTLEEGEVLHYLDSNYVDKSGKRLLRRVIFTPEEKEKIVRESHIITDTGQHKSKATTHSSVSVYYYWPHMAREVANFIRRCEVCSNVISPSLAANRTRRRPRGKMTENQKEVESRPGKLSIKKQKAKTVLEKRREKFLELFQTKGENGASMEDVQSDHGYSIQSPVKPSVDCDNENSDEGDDINQENLSEIAGNEVEVNTEGSALDRDVKTEPELSGLEPLSAAVELALAGEKSEEGCVSPGERNSSVIDHSLTSTPNTNRKGKQKLYCPQCGLQVGGYIKLQVHMSSHTGEKPFTCKICGAKVRSIKSIRQHEMRHRGKLNEKRFLCDVCGKDFKSILLLRNHKRSSHGKTFTCAVCEQNFPSQAALQKHEALCSPEGLECKICHEICGNRAEYRAHILNHAGLEVRQKLERVDQVPLVSQEETTRATAEVEEELVQVQIEITDGVELPVEGQQYEITADPGSGEHGGVVIADGNAVSTETSTLLTSSENLETSLLQLAEQVVQARQLGPGEVEYQIVYPDNSSQIVTCILQHEQPGS